MRTIKRKFTLIITFIIISINAFAQGGGVYQIKFSYDNAGNRVRREIILQIKSQQQNDSLQPPANDTVASSVNLDSSAYDQQDETGISDTNGTSQYADMLGDQQIVIYPNPTTGRLQVKITPFNTEIPAEITVYDLQGRLILEKSCTSELTIVDFSKFTTASYILKVRLADKQSEWKIVKQ